MVAAALYEHPVVRIAQGILIPTEAGMVVDEDGRELLAYALERHGKDDTLPSAVIALYELAAALVSKKSTAAASAILEVLVNVRPKLPALVAARQQRAAASLAQNAVKSAPKYAAVAPKGSMKLTAFTNTGNQRPPGKHR